MVSAELKYRTYVPSDYIAVEFADLIFNGNPKIYNLLDDLAALIKYEKYKINHMAIEHLTQKKQVIEERIEKLKSNITAIRKKYKILFLNKEANLQVKQIQNEIQGLCSVRCSLCNKIEELDNDLWFSASKLKYKFKDLLAQLDFTCKSSHKIGDITNAEIYEFAGDEEVLAVKARIMTDALKNEINKKAEEMKKRLETTEKTSSVKER